TCGGQCIIGPVCEPGRPCPEYASRLGECTADANGACECMPVQEPTPTPGSGCQSDDDCNDGIGCTVDRCDQGVCEHLCICLSADGASPRGGGPGALCIAPCGGDAAGSCKGFCPAGSSCESSSSGDTACQCVSGPGGPCGGNILSSPPVCAPGLVCHQSLPDV